MALKMRLRLRLPEPGSFEDLPHPVRIEVVALARLSRHPATDQPSIGFACRSVAVAQR